MTTTEKWTIRLACFGLSVLLLAALIWGLSRTLYPTEEQRQTVAKMLDLAEPEGRNAFGLLWTITHAVPERDIPSVVESDRQRLEEWIDAIDWNVGQLPEFRSAALDYPDLTPSHGNGIEFCPSPLDGCLTRVRQDLHGYRDLIEEHQVLLDRIARLDQYDYYRTRLPLHMLTPLPSFGPLSYLPTRYAVMFADGDIDAALAASCTQLKGWRRLSADADALIAQLIGHALVREYGYLLTEMVDELPLDYPLPQTCQAALALPQPQEVSLCTAMRGEFALITSLEIGPSNVPASWLTGLGRFAYHLGYDDNTTQAEAATRYALHCSDEEIADNLADVYDTTDPQVPGLFRLACAGNWIGCILNQISTPAWSQYQLRARDYGARLRLLHAWHQARLDAAGEWERMLDSLGQRLNELSHEHRRYELDLQAGKVRVELYEARQDRYWALPLTEVSLPPES